MPTPSKSSFVKIFTVFVLVSALVVVSPIQVIALSDDIQDQLEKQREGEPPEPHPNLDAEKYYGLWSMTPDDVVSEYESILDDVPDNHTSALVNRTAYMVASSKFVTSYTEYPQIAKKWNKQNLLDYEPGNKSVSHYPVGESTDSGQWVSDAFVDIVSLTPTARIHDGSGAGEVFASPRGAVNYVGDYRVTLPDDIDTNETRVSYTLKGHQLGVTRAYVDGSKKGFSTGHSGTVGYAGLSPGEHTIKVNVSVRARVDVHREEKKTTCVDRNETTGECNQTVEYWETVRDEVVEDVVNVSDTRTVTVTELNATPTIRYRNHPNGYSIVRVSDLPNLWNTLEFPEDSLIMGPYRLYSQRDPEWDRVNRATGSVVSKVHPAQLHVVPAGKSISPLGAYNGVSITITDQQGRNRSVPTTAPDRITDYFETPNETYQQTTAFDFRTHWNPILSPGNETVVITDFTGGREIIDAKRDGAIRRSELNASFPNSSDVPDLGENETAVAINLTDASGQPINTASRDGYILLNSEHRVNTSGDGTTTAILPGEVRRVKAEYHPSDDWKYDTIYLSSRDFVWEMSDAPSIVTGILDWAPIIFLGGVLYLFIRLIRSSVTGTW